METKTSTIRTKGPIYKVEKMSLTPILLACLLSTSLFLNGLQYLHPRIVEKTITKTKIKYKTKYKTKWRKAIPKMKGKLLCYDYKGNKRYFPTYKFD